MWPIVQNKKDKQSLSSGGKKKYREEREYTGKKKKKKEAETRIKPQIFENQRNLNSNYYYNHNNKADKVDR